MESHRREANQTEEFLSASRQKTIMMWGEGGQYTALPSSKNGEVGGEKGEVVDGQEVHQNQGLPVLFDCRQAQEKMGKKGEGKG